MVGGNEVFVLQSFLQTLSHDIPLRLFASFIVVKRKAPCDFFVISWKSFLSWSKGRGSSPCEKQLREHVEIGGG
jgi:hypothetical protein